MTTHNLQQAHKIDSLFTMIKRPMNHSRRSRLTNLILTIGMGFIFLFGLLNLLYTSSSVAAAETAPARFAENPSSAEVATAPQNNLPEEVNNIVAAGFADIITSTRADESLTVGSTETRYVDEVRTNLISTTVVTGEVQLPVVDSNGFVSGQEVLIMVMDGEMIGQFETAVIADVINGTTLELSTGLTHAYDGASAPVLVQKVPNYDEVVVDGTLTAHAWDGYTGGVLFFRAMTVTVNAGGEIVADGLGFGPTEGPGGGNNGGSHGGLLYAYGNPYQPTAMGSGGNDDSSPTTSRGGGVIMLNVAHLLQNEGSISTHGNPGTLSICTGGGAGGSIWIHSREINGDGTISAIGGAAGGSCANTFGMGGSGGRIALYADIDQYSKLTDAFQIFGAGRSAPGTIYLNTDVYPQELWVEGNEQPYTLEAALTEGSYQFNRIRLIGDCKLRIKGSNSHLTLNESLLAREGNTNPIYTALSVEGDLTVPTNFEVQDIRLDVRGKLVGPQVLTMRGSSVLFLYAQETPYYDTYNFDEIIIGSNSILRVYPFRVGDTNYTNDRLFSLNVDTLIIEPDGLLSASENGYSYSSPGAGTVTGAGAGHGGYDGSRTGAPYGNIYHPVNLGSGGRGADSRSGAGGGAIHLIATTLLNDGTIASNGQKGYEATSNRYGCRGGGSGGSLWIETDVITGTGVIEAIGADGGDCSSYGTPNGFGGSGGRIALYAQADYFSYRDNAYNVNGSGGAQPGTVYLEDHITLDAQPTLLPNGETSSLTVTVQTNDDIPVANKGVSLTVNAAGPTFMNAAGQLIPAVDGFYSLGETDDNGVVTATISSNQSGDFELVALENGIWASPAQNIIFEAYRLSGMESDLDIIDESVIPADGVTPAKLRVTARDQFGNPFSGLSAELLRSDPTVTVTPISTATSELGYFDFEVTHIVPGTAVFTATISDGGTTEEIPQTAVLTFIGTDLNVFGSNLLSKQAAGLSVPWPLTVKNEGLIPAENVVVIVTLPTELNFNGPTNDNVSYDSNNHQVIWTIDNIDPNTFAVVTLQTEIDESAPYNQQIVTAVTASTTSAESNLDNNSFSHTLLVTKPEPQVVISPTSSEHYLEVGQTAVHKLTVANQGTAAAEALNLVTHYNWITLNSPSMPQTLPIHATREWFLEFNANVEPGRYLDHIEISGSNVDLIKVPTTIYVDNHVPTVTVNISNTAYAPVRNATVTLVRNTPRDVYVDGVWVDSETVQVTGRTNIKGELSISQLPVGTYNMIVTAEKHDLFTDTVTINADTNQLGAQLVAYPSLEFVANHRELAVVAGGSAEYQLVVRNNGPGHAEGFTLQTPNNIPWLSAALPTGVDRLEANEEMLVNILLNPPADQDPTTYLTDPIILNAANAESDQTQLTIHVTTVDVGFLAFSVKDQMGEPIEGAKVTIISQKERVIYGAGGAQDVTRDWFTALSDSNGDVVFNDLLLTDYTYSVESNGYYIEQGVLAAQPVPIDTQALTSKSGLFKPTDVPPVAVQTVPFLEELVEIILNQKPFAVFWDVEPVDIQDTYAFTVEVVYVATVDPADLFISNDIFCTPRDSRGSDTGEWLIVNTGVTTMTDIVLNPSYGLGIIDILSWDVTGENISGLFQEKRFLVADSLAPGESITVPYTVTSNYPGTDLEKGIGWLDVEAQYELEAGDIADYKNRIVGNPKYCSESRSYEINWSVGEDGKIVGSGYGALPDFGEDSPTIPVNQEIALKLLIGDATMERQGFMARLHLQSQTDGTVYVGDIEVTLNIFEEETGKDVTKLFAIDKEMPTPLGELARELDGVDGEWLIVPGDLGITQTEGADYQVTARIDYTVNEIPRSYTTDPATIRIYPHPDVRLNYSNTQPQEDGSFEIEVKAYNAGYGPARNLTLDLGNLFMNRTDAYGDIDNNGNDEDGRSLIFELMKTTVGGEPQSLKDGFKFEFGTIAPSTAITGRWTISVTASDGSYLKDAIITQFNVKCRHLPYNGTLKLSSLINCDDHNDYIFAEDPDYYCVWERQRIIGGPINTTTGNYSYIQNGFTLPTIGDSLEFNWFYNSLNAGAFPGAPPLGSPLGTGWSYEHHMWLDLQASDVITLHTDSGTAVRINRYGNILTPADEKFCAGMTVEDVGNGRSLYTVHSDNQTTSVFSDTGKLISRTDAQGHDVFFTYDETGENLSRVEEPISGQFLDFTYDEATGRLELVTETTGRTFDFVYDATTGLLSSVIDPRGQEWQYEYIQLADGQDVLYRVIDPDQRIVEETGFDEFGRAISQTYNGRSLSITYDGQHRIVKDGNGGETVLFYDRKELLVGERDALGNSDRYAFDINQNRIWHENGNDVPMNVESNPAGYKTLVENALGQSHRFEYDDRNNMTYVQDPRGHELFFAYNTANQPISMTNPFGDSIQYTYNENGQITSLLDENDHLTQYGYDDLGRQTVVTDALGNTMLTAYDNAWRVISTTDALSKVTLYNYDAADNLLQTTENAWEGKPQNYLDEYNIVTEYGYDGRGNQTHVTDTLGMVTRSFYGDGNLLAGKITNWQGSITDLSDCQFPPAEPDKDLCTLYTYDNEENLIVTTDPLGRQSRTFYDLLNRTAGTIKNWDGSMTLATCQFPPTTSDQNLCTRYQYDDVSNQILMTDTVGHQTYTFYNEVNRAVGKVTNWQGTISDLSDCQFPPTEPDKDLCTLYEHDEVGQVIVTTDPLGRQTRTFYDALGRKMGEVVNWQPGFTLDDCVLSADNLSQTNVCTLYEYDKVGNRTVMINALGQKTLTVYDALNRSVATIANWDGVTEIEDADECAGLPATAEQNICSVTDYDALGRTLQATDALGNISTQAYDSLGRVVTTTRYLSNTLVTTINSYDALGRLKTVRDARDHTTSYTHDELGRVTTITSPENVIKTQTYDAVGRVVEIMDGLEQVTQQEFDALNRPVRIINAEGNISEREYDASGNVRVSIDAAGVRTEHEYDDLNRLTAVTENKDGDIPDSSNIRTEYTYDALGNQLTTASDRDLGDGQTEIEITEYDSLNRPIRTIDPLGHATETMYDAVGNTRVLTAANGEVTLFTYDGLNRTKSINYVADGQTVTYAYDALGNTRMMSDSMGVTRYDYDDFYRLTEVINAFNEPVRYAYDLNGNRTQLTYPDGKVVNYVYDADNRLTTVTDWLSSTTNYEYDIVGRLISTTLPNGVIATQQYDKANRLTGLRYEQGNGTLVAEYGYQLNDLGFREVVTETIYIPETVDEIHAFIEQNGQLVMEAEHGQEQNITSSHNWAETAVLPDHTGSSYLQALPDIGVRYQTDEINDSPQRSYVMSITNAADYTLWVRGMATDSAGDSLHVGLNGNVLADASELTGFAPREWSWTAVTMNNLTATVDIASTNLYTLDLWMREDGLRIDQLLLTDDPDYTPPTSGLPESPYELVTSDSTAGYLSSWVIHYNYDPLHRLTSAAYSGDISATFAYAYDPVGNMTAYTETMQAESGELQTRQVIREFDDANAMIASTDSELGTTSYLYDRNGNLTEVLPPAASEQQPVRYAYDQRNLLLTGEVNNGDGSFAPRMAYTYDGNGQRIRLIDYGTVAGQTPVTTIFTNDISGLSQVLLSDDGATQTTMLYGLDLIGSRNSDVPTDLTLLLADGLGSVRIEMVAADIVQATTYGPYGNVFHTVGEAGTVYGFTGEETDTTGLIYLRARYYNPALRTFMSRDPFSGYMERPQSQNGYSYVEGNPVNYIDPTGELAELILIYEVLNTAYDIVQFYQDLQLVLFDWQHPECGNLEADLISLGWDFVALLPVLTSAYKNTADAFSTVSNSQADELLALTNNNISNFVSPVTLADEVGFAVGKGLAEGSQPAIIGRFDDILEYLGESNLGMSIADFKSLDPPLQWQVLENASEQAGVVILNAGPTWTSYMNGGFVTELVDDIVIRRRDVILVSDPFADTTHFGINSITGERYRTVTSTELSIFEYNGLTFELHPDGNWRILLGAN